MASSSFIGNFFDSDSGSGSSGGGTIEYDFTVEPTITTQTQSPGPLPGLWWDKVKGWVDIDPNAPEEEDYRFM